MDFKIDRNLVLLVALGVLALALVFFSWVLQLPSLASTTSQPPASGVVEVNVVPTPTPEGQVQQTAGTPSGPQPCDGLPDELKVQCEQSLQATPSSVQATASSEPQPCDGLPEELKTQCLQSLQNPTPSASPSSSEPQPCDGLPPELMQQCLSSMGG